MATPTIMSFKKRYMNDGAIGTPEIKKPRLEDMFNLMLVDELVVKIFSYLHHKDLLMAAALVCKRWEHLSMDPDLWRSLDLGYMSDVTTETVEKLLERFKRMKCIKLSQRKQAPLVLNVPDIGPRIQDSVIPFIAEQNCLQRLHLNRQKELSPSSLGSIANCRSLLHLALSSTQLNDDALRMIGKSCIKLRTLEIRFCNITTDGGYIWGNRTAATEIWMAMLVWSLDVCRDVLKQVDDSFLIALAAKPSQIGSLDISKCKFTSYGLEYLGKLPKLFQLSAADVGQMNEKITSKLTGLKCLGLEKISHLSNDGVSTIVRNNPNLEVLVLSKCESIDDAALYIISMGACRLTLKKLSFWYCPISESGLINILENCAKLRELHTTALRDDTLEINYPHVKFYRDIHI